MPGSGGSSVSTRLVGIAQPAFTETEKLMQAIPVPAESVAPPVFRAPDIAPPESTPAPEASPAPKKRATAKAKDPSTLVFHHLIDRIALAGKCPRCNNRVLVAIDGGLDIAADPDALDIRAEAAARLSGLVIVDLERYDGRRSYLRYRDLRRMKRPRILPVLAQHRCADGTIPHIPWEIPAPRARPSPRKAAVNTTAPVPF
jgi:hypothetical protein